MRVILGFPPTVYSSYLPTCYTPKYFKHGNQVQFSNLSQLFFCTACRLESSTTVMARSWTETTTRLSTCRPLVTGIVSELGGGKKVSAQRRIKRNRVDLEHCIVKKHLASHAFHRARLVFLLGSLYNATTALGQQSISHFGRDFVLS